MALLTPQQIGITGPTITHAAAGASDTVKPDDRLFLHYLNTNAATRDITVVVPGTKFGQALADVVVTIAATTGEEFIGPITRDLADPDTGLVTVTTSAQTNLTVAAVRV
jgi:hypothetical protein